MTPSKMNFQCPCTPENPTALQDQGALFSVQGILNSTNTIKLSMENGSCFCFIKNEFDLFFLQAEKEEQGAIEKAPVKDESQDQWTPSDIPTQVPPTQEVTDWASEAMPVAPAPQPFMPSGTAKDWSATTDDWSAAASGPAPTAGAPEWGGTAAENWNQNVNIIDIHSRHRYVPSVQNKD